MFQKVNLLWIEGKLNEIFSGDEKEERNSVKKSKKVNRRIERRDSRQRADASILYDRMCLFHNQCSGSKEDDHC